MTNQINLERYLSRKFLLALATVASATWLVFADHITDGVYSAVVIGTITAYFASNVTQKIMVTKDSTSVEVIEE